MLWSIVIVLLLAAGGRAEPRALVDGMAMVATGNYGGAVLALRPLAEGNDDAVLHYWLGRAYYGQRNYRLAAEHLTLAVERDPGNEEACGWHARALRMAGELDAAAQAYAAYAARFPHNGRLRGEYIAARALAGDVPGARAALAQWLADQPAAREQAASLRRLFDGRAAQQRLEPPLERRTPRFTLQYTAIETTTDVVLDEVERLRAEVSAATGITVTGFRVLLFADADAYRGYAGVLLPESGALHAAAFSTPGLLVLCSPAAWPRNRQTLATLRTLLRHEIAHLAITQAHRGDGVPLWLHEGLACYFGGWGGQQTGRPPAKPMTPAALDRAFQTGDGPGTTPAYAQAHAMATVMARALGVPGLFHLLDLVGDGTPLPDAYARISGEPFATFLAEWPTRFAAE